MGHSLRTETIEKISRAQEPTDLTDEEKAITDIKVAMTMIENGYDWHSRSLVHNGVRLLVNAVMPTEEYDPEMYRSRKILFLLEMSKYTGG